MEDPFEVSYDVSHVLRDSTFRTIRLEAARAYAMLTGIHAEHSFENAEACLEELCREVAAPVRHHALAAATEDA